MKYQILKSILFLILAGFFFSSYSFAAEKTQIVAITVYSDTVAFEVDPGPGFQNVAITIGGPYGFHSSKRIDDNESSVIVDLPLSEDGSGVAEGEYRYQITAATPKDKDDIAPNKIRNDNLRLNRMNNLSVYPWTQKGIFTIKDSNLIDSTEL